MFSTAEPPIFRRLYHALQIWGIPREIPESLFLSGIWLSHSGKPYSVIILAIHKLISLAAGVFLVMTVYRMNQAAKLSAVELIAAVVTGLLFLGTVISGGLLSTGKPMPTAISTMHQITPFLTVLSTATTLYLLLSRK